MCPNRIKLDLDMKRKGGGSGVEGLNYIVLVVQKENLHRLSFFLVIINFTYEQHFFIIYLF